MKITAIETIRTEELPNILWVQVHTDEGLVGLGETFFGAQTVEAYLHEYAAPRLIGQDPSRIDRIARDLVGYLGFRSAGAETRGNSAIDIALWDLLGKALNRPIVDLLGGRTRDRIRTYNTCAGTHYVRKANAQRVDNWGLGTDPTARYDDLNAFLNRADELAADLLEEGITAMKIWPFDPAAEKTNGVYIAPEDLKTALQPFEKIRRAVGDRMDIMVEFHSLWQLLPAMQIAKALTPYGTFWHEDPIRMDSLSSLKRYAEASPAPICASETLASRWAFRDLLETGVAGVASGPPRLHRPRGAHRLDASLAQRAQCPGAGERARLLPHLVSRSRDGPPGGLQRHDHRTRGAGPRREPEPRSRQALHRDAARLEGRLGVLSSALALQRRPGPRGLVGFRQRLTQARPAALASLVADRTLQRLPLAEQHHEPLAARHACVEQVPP
jgi:L-alanine-DL-glutamate epimerase-like enolase superfamily enzyme